MKTFKRDPNKQVRYEMFLDAVQKKEDAYIVSSVPGLLNDIEHVMKYFSGIPAIAEHKNWREKTLPKIRANYASIRKCKDAREILKLLEDTASNLNGWCHLSSTKHHPTPVCVEVYKAFINDSYSGFDSRAVRICEIALRLKEVPQKA